MQIRALLICCGVSGFNYEQRWKNDHLPDRIIAGLPHLDESGQVWRVPVTLSYPQLGILGEVGEVVVHPTTGEIVTHTPVEQSRAATLALAKEHREQIEAPFHKQETSYSCGAVLMGNQKSVVSDSLQLTTDH